MLCVCMCVLLCDWVGHVQLWVCSHGPVVLDLTIAGQTAGWEGGRAFVRISSLVAWPPTMTLLGSLA